ncbi:MAG: methyltransferase [Armatimonadetes bacterium]|nr:methyltransferase [Armatimonadota bacterium]
MNPTQVDPSRFRKADPEALRCLPARLQAAGLTEDSLRELLSIRDVPLIKPQEMPGYLWRCRKDNSPRALLACLWLLGQWVPGAQASKIMGEDAVHAMVEAGLLADDEALVGARVDLYPCQGTYLVTDCLLARSYQEGHVYQLGTDSYALARATPRKKVRRALDLCTGSGIHAIMAARHADEVVGVDLNPRAVDYARLNARLNSVEERCRFEVADLYAPVQGQLFDLITVNPPFVPTPDDTVLRHRTGGRSGEEISRRLVAGLPRHLEIGGTFAMVLDYPVMRRTSYLERLQRWLGQSKGWGIAVLSFGNVPIDVYIQQHVAFDGNLEAYHQAYTDYLRSYERQGIVEIGFANVYIRRLPADRQGWAVERSMITPHTDVSARVERWLDCLERYRDPGQELDWDGWKPRLSELVGNLWLDQGGGKAWVEYCDLHAFTPLSLEDRQATVARLCAGQRTAREVAAAVGDDADEQLRFLAQAMVVE